MPELKTLQDFYDPTRAGVQALSMLQMQQHMALQQQNQAAQQKNMEIDNLQKMLQTTDPMQSYAIQKKINDHHGIETPPVDEYYANLPYKKRLEGAKQLGKAAGIATDDNVGALIEHSGPLQKEIGNALALGPLEKAKAQELELKMQEHHALKANTDIQLNALVPMMSQLKVSIAQSEPHVSALAAIQQKYEKDAKSVGITKAAEMRRESILLNPELQQFSDMRMQRLPQYQKNVQELETQLAAMQADGELMSMGSKPIPEGHSIHTIAANVDATVARLALEKAKLAFAKDPSAANIEALRNFQSGLESKIARLNEKVQGSQDSLDIRRDAQHETARQHQVAEARTAAVGNAQVAWMESGGNLSTAHRYAKQFGVRVDEVTKAAEDPNRTTSTVNVNSYAPASVEAQRDYMKGARTTYDQLKQAQPLLDNIDRAKALIPKAKGFMGTGGETLLEAAKFLNNRAGMSVNTEGVKSAEELRSRIFFNIMDNLKKMDAQPSQQQQQIMQESLGKLGTDPTALPAVLDAYADVVKGKVEQYNEDVAGAEKRGVKFPYDPTIRLRTGKAPSKDTGSLSESEQQELDALRKRYGR
jgi:hypothetical protein